MTAAVEVMVERGLEGANRRGPVVVEAGGSSSGIAGAAKSSSNFGKRASGVPSNESWRRVFVNAATAASGDEGSSGKVESLENFRAPSWVVLRAGLLVVLWLLLLLLLGETVEA